MDQDKGQNPPQQDEPPSSCQDMVSSDTSSNEPLSIYKKIIHSKIHITLL